jgi:hypothetical protein
LFVQAVEKHEESDSSDPLVEQAAAIDNVLYE